MSADKTKILVICGPTATGKTAAGIACARAFDGEIVSADSMQIYRTLDIGTAKPTAAQLAAAPHHLIDIKDPSEGYSVSEFCADAAAAIADISARGRLPIVVGGTGLYISSLIDGTVFSGRGVSEQLRSELLCRAEREGIAPLYDELRRVDPETAAGVHVNNKKRVLRALEYFYAEGEPISAQVARSHERKSPFDAVVLYLDYSDRACLYAAINERVDEMMERGLLAESRRVWERRDEYLCAAQAIGYKEFFGYFSSGEPLPDAVALLKQRSRNYAKRQISWFARRRRDLVADAYKKPFEMAENSEIIDEIAAAMC